jgi:hypothetical protein
MPRIHLLAWPCAGQVAPSTPSAPCPISAKKIYHWSGAGGTAHIAQGGHPAHRR